MFYLGLDLGQRRDHTAIAVVERRDRWIAHRATEFDALWVRHLERVPLGTPYPAVVERVREILHSRELAGRCSLTVDETGLGGPVVAMLRAGRLGCDITPVTITSGARATQFGASWNVPKRDLLAGVQVLLEQGELRIARKLKQAGALMRELMDITVRHTDSGKFRAGADGYGQHDDLAIALALACWKAKRPRIGPGGGRLTGC
jgi:hypothetical protein